MSESDKLRAEAVRQRIASIAQQEYLQYCFEPPFNQAGPDNQRIAAKLWEDDSTHKRQGWRHLSEIYAAAGRNLKVEIDEDLHRKYKDGTISRDERNMRDMGSWCGFFALHCYRQAGLNMRPWPLDVAPAFTEPMGRDLLYHGAPELGDIGRIPQPINHHFVVIAVSGATVYSVDGNDDPQSQIKVHTRTLAALRAAKADFYYPNWEKHLGIKLN